MAFMRENQSKIRGEFVKNWLNEKLISANYANRELIFNTGDEEFPYIHLTIAALNNKEGNEKIIELIEKQNAYEDMLNKKRMKKERLN